MLIYTINVDCDYQTAIRHIMPIADSVDDSSGR